MTTEEYIIICHDNKAMIYDIFNHTQYKKGFDYLDCIEEATNYEIYDDSNIAKLSEKLIKNIDRVLKAINNKEFEKAILLDNFCFNIEPYKK